MKIMAVYIAVVIVGEFLAYGIGRGVEIFSETLSLPVFLALFFSVFFFGWRFAVRLTA
jgi:hypothetical protein